MPHARLTSLDAVKGIGIIAVICIHAAPPTQEAPPVAWQIFNQVCRFAVPVFFIIAGFLFMGAWQREASRGLLLRRYAVRLLKLFFFWALFFAVIPPYVSGAPQGNWPALLLHLELILRHPHSFLISGFVYHLWFLSSLLQGIGLVWLCLRFWNARGALLVGGVLYAVALLGASYAGMRAGFHVHFDMKSGPFTSTLWVALGVWLASRRKFSLAAGLFLTSAGLACHLAEALWLRHEFLRPLAQNDFLIGTIPYAVGLVWLALARPSYGRMLAGIGAGSLGMYALHVYVIECLRRLPLEGTRLCAPWFFAGGVFMITWVVVLLLARVRWLRPFLR